MGKVKDITGQVFGRLTVIAPAPTPEGKKSHNQHWKCLCECGKEVVVRGCDLTSGNTKSCGCRKGKAKKAKDITGQVFGRLTVIAPAPIPEGKKSHNQHWKCLCECGKEVIVNGSCLIRGETRSCGCLKKEQVTKHGKSKTKLYRAHHNMKQRCENQKHPLYKYYGARGIKVFAEWLDKESGFMNFYNWSMLHGYKEGLTIDRISNDGNYEPNNCRWTDMSVQCANRRQRSNKTGHIGIVKQPNGKYAARICKNYKSISLGAYDTIEEAVEARERAERELYPEKLKQKMR